METRIGSSLKGNTEDHKWIMPNAKVFMNGGSQTIRLPKDFRVSTEEVILQKTPDGILILEQDPLEIMEEAVLELSDVLEIPKREPDPQPSRTLDLEQHS